MGTTLSLAALIASTVLALSADIPPDLTGAGDSSFKAHLGKVVTLSGRLEQGMQGPCLFGSPPTNVVFYVVPDMPLTGSYTYPPSWERLMHKQVRVTGGLTVIAFRQPQLPLRGVVDDEFISRCLSSITDGF